MRLLHPFFASRTGQSADTSAKRVVSDGEKSLDEILFNEDFWEYARKHTLRVAIAVFTDAYLEGVRAAQFISPTLGNLAVDAEPNFVVDLKSVEQAAAEKIKTFTNTWWDGLEATTKTRLRNAIIDLPKIGMKGVIQRAETVFSHERAELIATTETTRLYGAGAIESYREAGLEQWRWQTVRDSHVDPECVALNGQEFPIFIDFEPLHPRCRCFPRPIVPLPE